MHLFFISSHKIYESHFQLVIKWEFDLMDSYNRWEAFSFYRVVNFYFKMDFVYKTSALASDGLTLRPFPELLMYF